MDWAPPIELVGSTRRIKISATDISTNEECGLSLALKVHPDAYAKGWAKSWARPNPPFPLGDVVDHIKAIRGVPNVDNYHGLTNWMSARFDQLKTHPCLRIYIQQAVENYLDAHEGAEAEFGPMRLVSSQPEFTIENKSINAWAPMYETNSGLREIRRLRIGSAHDEPTAEDLLWAISAAFVSAKTQQSIALNRIRVVEYGLVDGTTSILFDGTPQESRTQYIATVRDHAKRLVHGSDVNPCRSCGSCKAAGVCSELVNVTGMLGQDSKGYGTRSVSPSDLEHYSRCPAQWLLARSANLPKDKGSTPEQRRGLAAHEWLKAAHRSNIPCGSLNLSAPPVEAGGNGYLTLEDFSNAIPYIEQHMKICPLNENDVEIVSAEKDVYGYDSAADVVPVSRPDLMYKDAGSLVIRDFKTAKDSLSGGRNEVFDTYKQVSFFLSMLKGGLAAHHGATSGRVEVEILTASGSELYSWSTENKIDTIVANSDLKHAVEGWHKDSEWKTNPGPQCGWCPVRKWCPDRDSWQQEVPPSASDGILNNLDSSFAESPPF